MINGIFDNTELPGLSKHCKMIDKLIESYLPKLSKWLVKLIKFEKLISFS